MTKRSAKNSTASYATRAHKQHASLVTTIPKAVCHALGIESGDILCFEVQCGKGVANFFVQIKGVKHNGRSPGNTDRPDSGGAA